MRVADIHSQTLEWKYVLVSLSLRLVDKIIHKKYSSNCTSGNDLQQHDSLIFMNEFVLTGTEEVFFPSEVIT